MVEGRSALKIVTGKVKRNRLLGRPRNTWKDNVRMDLKEIAIYTKNLVDSDQDKGYWRALYGCGFEPPGFIYHQ